MTGEPMVPGRATVSTEQAAKLLGVSEDCLWRAARDGDAPVPHFKCGRSLRWPVAPLLRLLELDADALTQP